MNAKLFQEITEHLLRAHYGIELGDTYFCETGHIENLIADNQRPIEAINALAERYSLTRIDSATLAASILPNTPLVAADEIRAMAAVNPIQIVGDQPETCPKCASRTDLDEHPSGQQHHRCLNSCCSHEFIAEDDENKDVDCDMSVATKRKGKSMHR